MTDGELLQIKYWFDLLVKAIIGIVVGIVGLDYKSLKNSLKELETKRYELTTQAEITHYEIGSLKDKLDRIEKKLDKAIDK